MNASDYCMVLKTSPSLFMSAVDRQSENPRSTEHSSLSSRRIETLFVQLVAWCMLQEKKIFLSAPTQLHLTFFIYVALEIWDELSWFSVVVCSMLEFTFPLLQTALGWKKGFHIRSQIVLHRFLKLYRKVLVAGVAYFRIPSDYKDIF